MIKVTLYSPANREDVIRDIMLEIQKTGKKSSICNEYVLKTRGKTPEEVSKTNKWIIFTSKSGKCEVVIEGKPKLIEFSPDEIKVIKIETGKKFYLKAFSRVLGTCVCEIL